MAFALLATINDEDTLTYEDASNDNFPLSWVKPTLHGNNATIAPATITGYQVFRNGSPGSYEYAVRATFSGGQTVLGNVIYENDWVRALPAQTAGNTFDNTASQATIQAHLDSLAAAGGGALYLDGSAGAFSWTTTGALSAGHYLSITDAQTSSHTSANYIYIIGINNAHIQGVGSDSTPAGDQTLIDIGGHYVRGYNFRLSDSGKYGANLHGTNIEFREVEADNNWLHGIVYGDENADDQHVNNIIIKFCEAHHNRTGGGIACIVEDNTNYNVDDVSVIRCLQYKNGWARNDDMFEFLGGNSDGHVIDKKVNSNYIPGDHLDPVVTGRENRSRNLIVGDCLSFENADDNKDISSGDGTIVSGVCFHNGPSGADGLKVFSEIYEEQTYGNLVLIGSSVSIFPNTVVYTDNKIAGRDFVVGNTVRGRSADDSSIGATGTVVSYTPSTNVSDQGILVLSGVTGNWRTDDIIEDFTAGQDICGTSVANPGVLGLGNRVGFDGRVNDSLTSRSYGKIDIIGLTTLNHNLPGALACRGFSLRDDQGNCRLVNMASTGNKSADSIVGYTPETCILNSDPAPNLENVGNYTRPALSGSTIEEKHRNLFWNVTGHYMPTSAGNCRNNGTTVSAKHHTTAADDLTNPSHPDDYSRIRWTGTQPDTGGIPYEYIRPPVTSTSAVGGGGGGGGGGALGVGLYKVDDKNAIITPANSLLDVITAASDLASARAAMATWFSDNSVDATQYKLSSAEKNALYSFRPNGGYVT